MKIGSLGPQGVRVRSWFGGWLWLYETVKKKKSTNFSVLLSINPACLTYTDKWMPGQFMGGNKYEKPFASIFSNYQGVRHEALKLRSQMT